MFRLTVTQLRAHKRRLVSTVLAVALGIAFLAGTLVLSDTTRSTFDDLFRNVNAGTDVIVRPEPIPGFEMDESAGGRTFDSALVDRLAAIDGVDRARPAIEGYGKLVGLDGKPIGTMGPPNLAGHWLADPALNPYQLVDGRAPSTDTEVVVNQAAADTGRLKVGDTTQVLTPDPVTVTIVGLARFGTLDSAGGSTYVGFTLDGAQRHIIKQPGMVTAVVVVARPGTTADELATRISAALPDGLEAVTGAQLAAEQRQAIDADFLDSFDQFLLAFAAVALLVATFSIYNTFSIIVAQRTRESALLRALGASRGQVLRATLVETLAIGLVASAAGLIGGIGLAVGLKSLFSGLGVELPATGLVIGTRTVVASLSVGTILTLAAGILPAVRASRVAPLAALRDVAVDRSSTSRWRLGGGIVLTAIGIGLVLAGVSSGLTLGLLGTLALLVGSVVLGPAIAVPLSRIVGWPLAMARRTSGRLARENAVRNPRRTSGTAAALMIGVTVVTLFTVVASSLKVSVEDSIGRSFAGDLVVSAGGGGTISPAVAADIADEPDVDTAVGIGVVPVRMGGEGDPGTPGPLGTAAMATDPVALNRVLAIDTKAGSLDGLGPRQFAVADQLADERQWSVGTTVPVRFADGLEETFTVGAVYAKEAAIDDVLMQRDDVTPHAVQAADVVALVKLRDGADRDEAQRRIEAVADGYPGTEVQTRQQYVDAIGANINQSLVMVYVMLALAIVIAVGGIATTLSLSIHERTRELGLLRAVGQTRRQVRSMVRGEAVIISLFGAGLGVIGGVFLGWGLVRATASAGLGVFAVPPAHLVAIVGIGALAGIVAAARPARRAARLDVLRAIATE